MNMTSEPLVPGDPPKRRPYGFLGASAMLFVGLMALGTWQLDRLDQKEKVIADRKAMLAMRPLDLSRDNMPREEMTYRRATVRGDFLYQKTLRIGPKPRQGRLGWQVITPFKRSDDGTVVFVDRGWVADGENGSRNSRDQQKAAPIALTGFIKTVGKRGPFVPDNDPVKGDWYWIDPTAMAAHLRLSNVAPYWIVANGGPVAMPPNNHLQYAFTWFSLAAVLAVLTVAYWRKSSAGA
jgi:surfeit locus 1 family protein